MKRTKTRLEAETLRRELAVADRVRAAVAESPLRSRPGESPGAGAFASGRSDTADRVDDALSETGFGRKT